MNQNESQDKMSTVGTKPFLGGEGASFNGFIDFLKRNTPLVISVTLALLFVYGVILSNIAIMGDVAVYLRNPDNFKRVIIGTGRWGTPLLTNLFFIKDSGIYVSNFISVVSIGLFTLLFCYFIAFFTNNTQRRNGFIPPALILLSYSVWAQYFGIFYQNKIQTVFICLVLIAAYLLFDGLLTLKKLNTVVGFVLTFFSFCVYQPLMPLFLCIVFIFFVLLQENTDFPAKEYSRLVLNLCILFIIAFALSIISGIIVRKILKIYDNDYIMTNMVWNRSDIKSIIANILAYGYMMTIGAIPFVHSIFAPIMPAMYGSGFDLHGLPIADTVLSVSQSIGNVLLLPAVIAFLVIICLNANKRLPKDRRMLYVLSGFGVPFSIMFLVIASGEVIGTRILYSLPFASAFMLYYVASVQKTVLRRVFYCMILCVAFYQAQISAALLETFVRVSEFDTKITFDLDARIRNVISEDEKLPVAFINNMSHPFDSQLFWPKYDEIGHSTFLTWAPSNKEAMGNQLLPFMGVFGFHYGLPTPEQINKAYEASRDMPAYPLKGCVKNLGDVVVVKMGD
jgi:hypothetical protein